MAFPRLSPAKHLPVAQLRKRYESCMDPVERRHWRALWLLSSRERLSAREVALRVGCTSDWVRKVVRRYNAAGPAGLLDGRKRNGRRPLLDAGELRRLAETLRGPHPDGGRWTGADAAREMEAILNRPVDAVTGWRYLKKVTTRS